MTGVPTNSASAASSNPPQQQQRRPSRHGRYQTPRRQHFNSRGVPSFGGERGGPRSNRSLPRPSSGAPHGGHPHDDDGPAFHLESSRSYSKHHHSSSNHQLHHNGNGKQHLPRTWWSPFSTPEQVPAVFLPRECPACNKSPSSPWTMVEHLCSLEHCQNVLASRTAEYERTGQSGPRLLCELCRVPLLSVPSARNHFFGAKHRVIVRAIKRDLRNAGCADVPPDNMSDNRTDGTRSSKRSSSRGGSIDECERPVGAEQDGARSSADEGQGDDERKRRDCKTSNGYSQAQSLQQSQSTYTTSDTGNKDRRKQLQGSSARDRRSMKGQHEDQRSQTDDPNRNEGCTGNPDDTRKHQYFLSSEEEHSDEDGPVQATSRDSDRRREPFADDPRTPEARPKMPLGRPLVGATGRSLVDKRKDILSKLSNCTDVRDLTKQLRQIGRGADEKQKTARKMLPGVAYTNREIEKQETFGEARAKAAMEETIIINDAAPAVGKHGVKKGAGGNSGTVSSSSKNIKTEPASTKSTNSAVMKAPLTDENNDDCAIVSAPPEPPPQTISDSEDGEEQPPEALSRISPQCTTATSQLSGVRNGTPAPPPVAPQPLPNDELVRLAALTSEEAACQERLRYLSQTLPRVEALLGFLRQEEQTTLSQFELIRAAKSRIVAAVSPGSQPAQGSDIFGPSQIINAIIYPAARNPESLAWLLNSARTQGGPTGYNFGNVLGGVTAGPIPTSRPSASVHSLLNGVADDAASSFSTPQMPGASSDVRKRANASPKGPAVYSKRAKIAETQLDEQLHSEQVLAVHLSGDFVYSSSRDGVVKRTPLNDGEGAVVIYRHCGQDSNSSLKKVCAYMIEVSVHKKIQSVKVITGSDDCALRVFDGDTGHLMKVIPVQARVLCGFIAWQKIYIGLKSGYIQVYNLVDQRFLVESEVRQVPRFAASTQCASSKNVVVVTQDNAMMLRDAGTLFLLYAVDKRDQRITALIVKSENILLAGESKVYIFDKGGRLCREVELEENIFGAATFRTNLLVASASGFLCAINWKALINGQVQRRAQLAWTAAVSTGGGTTSATTAASSATSPAEIVMALHCNEMSRRIAIATEAGRVAVLDVTAAFSSTATASTSQGTDDARSSDEGN